jgi:L-glyceraldehyde 3-phosphate reductase
MWDGPYGEWGSRKYIVASLNQSLRRMGLEYVDIFYSHRFDPVTPLEETMMALDQIVRSGKALYAGISNYSPEKTTEAIKILENLGTPCPIHQSKYSMADRSVEKGLLKVLEDNGVGFVAFSPLAQGILSDRYLRGIPVGSRASKAHFLKAESLTQELLSKIARLNVIALERGQTLAQMATVWLLKDKRVTSVIVGVSSVTQLRDNLKSLSNTGFSEDELHKIEEITDSMI